jgi:hypothetical protein
VNVQTLELPELSATTQVTVLVPTGNLEPDGGVLETARLVSQLSLTTGDAKETAAPPESIGDSPATTTAGHVMLGGIVSRTVTVKLHALVLPQASTATPCTKCVPKLKNEPEGGVMLTCTFVSQRSVALTL